MSDGLREAHNGNVIEGRHYVSGEPIRIHMQDGLITRIESLLVSSQSSESATLVSSDELEASSLQASSLSDSVAEPSAEQSSASTRWIGPGFVDLQINGFNGIDFNSPPLDVAALHDVTRQLWAQGVTTYYPTVITNSDEAIEEMMHTIAKACETDELTSRSIAGIHVEGPFITPEDGARGAHNKQFVKAPDWSLFERWQKASGDRIRIVTLSPEWDEAPDFIANCVRNGIVASIGHTAATPEQIRVAVLSGATMSTHLGNGAHTILARHPNYIWEQLAQDRLYAGVIADGFHLPEAVLKVFAKVKGERFILVSDAVYLSGMAPGKYSTHIGGDVVLTPEGKLHLAGNDKILAGSASMLISGVAHMANTGIYTRGEAWASASTRPARFMNLAAQNGLTVGAPADLATFTWQDHTLTIHDVYKHGHCVVTSSESSDSSHV